MAENLSDLTLYFANKRSVSRIRIRCDRRSGVLTGMSGELFLRSYSPDYRNNNAYGFVVTNEAANTKLSIGVRFLVRRANSMLFRDHVRPSFKLFKHLNEKLTH